MRLVKQHDGELLITTRFREITLRISPPRTYCTTGSPRNTGSCYPNPHNTLSAPYCNSRSGVPDAISQPTEIYFHQKVRRFSTVNSRSFTVLA